MCHTTTLEAAYVNVLGFGFVLLIVVLLTVAYIKFTWLEIAVAYITNRAYIIKEKLIFSY